MNQKMSSSGIVVIKDFMEKKESSTSNIHVVVSIVVQLVFDVVVVVVSFVRCCLLTRTPQ